MKRAILTFFILCIITSSSFASQIEDKIKDAISLYKSGNYSECIKNLDTIISQDSNYPVAYYYLGLSYAKTNNKNKAIENYNKVISKSTDKSLCSMAKAAKDCLVTSGFTALDAQLSITNNSKAEDFVTNIKKEVPQTKELIKDISKKTNITNGNKTEKKPTDAEIGAAIMTLKRAGLWNGTIPTQQNVITSENNNQQDMMAKLYMQQMQQQMHNPAYLMMNMNNTNNNNNMMNMLPFLMSSQNGNNNSASNKQLIQTMMMSQMMPSLDFSSNDNNKY